MPNRQEVPKTKDYIYTKYSDPIKFRRNLSGRRGWPVKQPAQKNIYNPRAKLDTSGFVDVRNNPKKKKQEELKSKLAIVIWRSKNAYHKLNPLD